MWASGYSNILPCIKFCVTGQESGPQSPTISYRHTLCASNTDVIQNDIYKIINRHT